MTQIFHETTLMFGLHPLILDIFSANGGGKPRTIGPFTSKMDQQRARWVRTRANSGRVFSAHFGYFPEPPVSCGKRDMPWSRGARARPVELLFVAFY